MQASEIIHQPENHRFVLALKDTEAVLVYRLYGGAGGKGKQGVDFTHTYVPPAYRGQGIAEALVREGIRWARNQDHDVNASCWYAAKFIR